MHESLGDRSVIERSLLSDIAKELGLDDCPVPNVSREYLDLGGGQRISALRWGDAEPDVVFLHGGGQNAHTWDLVAMHLDRPALAIDLPGHGESSWRRDQDYQPARNAAAIATALEQFAPRASVVVGMSLGGLTTICLAGHRPQLVRRAMIVDVTPRNIDPAAQLTAAQRGAANLIDGHRTFETFEDMAEAAVQVSPGRAASAVRRGVFHNAVQRADGHWTWRYDVKAARPRSTSSTSQSLWDRLDEMRIPTMFVKAADSVFVTTQDLAEVARRLPTALVSIVPGTGHSIQSDQPRALSGLIEKFRSARIAP